MQAYGTNICPDAGDLEGKWNYASDDWVSDPEAKAECL
jgi:hypothetical protein